MEARLKVRGYIERNLLAFDGQVEFTDSDNIFERGFVSSLFAMKLVSFIEKEFSIIVDADDLEVQNFASVDNIINLVTRKQNP